MKRWKIAGFCWRHKRQDKNIMTSEEDEEEEEEKIQIKKNI